MNFRDFTQHYKNYPIITSQMLSLSPNPVYLRRLVSEWQKKGWLLRLRRGMWVINEDHFLNRLTPFYLANQIYFPSYVSLESALNFYGLIPEAVFATTSICTRKTATFENHFGVFRYRNLKKDLFFGFEWVKVQGFKVLLALPEKALLDFLYLNRAQVPDPEMVMEFFRLQHTERIKKSRLLSFLKKFNNSKLSALGKNILKSRKAQGWKRL